MGIIQKQGIQSTLITYSGILIGFVSLIVVQPALLEPDEIGLTRILYTFSFLVATLLPLSFTNITTRYFPKFRNEQNGHHGFFGLMLLWIGLGCLVFLPVLWIFHSFFIRMYTEKSALFSDYFLLVFPLSIIIALISAMSNFLSSAFRPLLPALAHEVIIRVLFILLICLYAFGWLGFRQFISGFLLIYLIQLIILLVYAKSEGQLSFAIDREKVSPALLREMAHYGWMIFLAGIASMAIKLTDVIVLGKYVSLSLTGVYAIAAFIPTFIEAPLTALDKVANARIAHSWETNDKKNIREIYYKSARYLFLLGGLLFLLVSLNAPHLFRWLPPAYLPGVPVITILSLAALFNLITGSNTAIIYTSSRFTAGAIALVGLALLNLVLLFLLIPEYGLTGAAWATCISSLTFNSFKYFFILFRFKLQPFDKRTLVIALSVLLTYGAGNLLPVFGNVWIDVILESLVILLVYGILIWYGRAADDLKELVPFFRKK